MLFTTVLTDSTLTVESALFCTGVSIALGLLAAFIYMYRNTYTKSFAVTLAVLPVLVQIVMMMVNGNLGTGIAVLGAFSLVRFRSVPGSAREILAIFFAMAIGLATGMGYLGFAAVLTVVISLLMLILNLSPFGRRPETERSLRITIPEDLDYAEVFDDLFAEFTTRAALEQVKTSNMGSLFELRYRLTLKDAKREKEFIDQLRCRNGNLSVVCGRPQPAKEEL